MTLFKRRHSRYARASKRARALQQRLPSAPDIPEIPNVTLPSVDASKLRDLSARQVRGMRKRVSRDTGGDTPMLSLAGGLLLGLLVGVVVAVILISRGEGEGAAQARPTGITLLPAQGEEASEHGESATVTG